MKYVVMPVLPYEPHLSHAKEILRQLPFEARFDDSIESIGKKIIKAKENEELIIVVDASAFGSTVYDIQ